jgi:hypothetical protein
MARINHQVSFAGQTNFSSDPSSPDNTSDKENTTASAARNKGKGRMPSVQSDPRSAKRRRIETHTSVVEEEDPNDPTRYYNPTQDQHERQDIKKKSRALEREFNGDQTIFLPTPSLTSPQKTRTLT